MASDSIAGNTTPREALITKLNQLKATATQQYALKNYSAAAESYSEAAEVQDELNGEMALENADLLYHYGRCLYHVGVSQSDVLGGKVAQKEEPSRKKRRVVKEEESQPNSATEKDASVPAPLAATETTSATASKPFFQITGDENWTDSEEEEEEAADEEPQEEDDDLAIAYEILDSARVLFNRKIEAIEPDSKDEKVISDLRQLRERLADTYDLQAEIKLENEQFKDAVSDAQQALTLKLQLYPQESGLIAEAHYKLSIALDFAALPAPPVDDANTPAADGKIDEEMRKQAAEEMEKAIMSCQARIKSEESSLASLEGAKLESQKRSIADAKDLVKDMKTRLVDLRNPMTGAASATSGFDADPLKGILGQMLGQSKAEQLKMLTQATASANDLSGLVKQKKKPKFEPTSTGESFEGKGKRKLGDAENSSTQTNGKKVKFEEP